MDISRHAQSAEARPWGFNTHMGGSYEDTLYRCASIRGDKPARRFQFDSDCFIRAVRNIFSPYSENLTELFNCRYISCTREGEKISSVTLERNQEIETVVAKYFIDCSGDIVLARDAGCDHTIGTEGYEEYGEPSATEKSDTINALTYVFRVTPAEDPNHVDVIPDSFKDFDLGEWGEGKMQRVISLIVRYPNGDLHVNMLPTMQGDEYLELGDGADAVGRARVYAYWNYLQTQKGLKGYTLKRIYDAGIRESYRLRGKYVLREQDLRAGILRQPKIGKTIAIADHSMDIHGKGGFNRALEYPYEIPIECAMTKEYSNLFVACRGASFTHIAASSARLSRTMISMGEGVGEHITELIQSEGN